jgi:hypothetical protein
VPIPAVGLAAIGKREDAKHGLRAITSAKASAEIEPTGMEPSAVV